MYVALYSIIVYIYILVKKLWQGNWSYKSSLATNRRWKQGSLRRIGGRIRNKNALSWGYTYIHSVRCVYIYIIYYLIFFFQIFFINFFFYYLFCVEKKNLMNNFKYIVHTYRFLYISVRLMRFCLDLLTRICLIFTYIREYFFLT